jgi:hypothetical protein
MALATRLGRWPLQRGRTANAWFGYPDCGRLPQVRPELNKAMHLWSGCGVRRQDIHHHLVAKTRCDFMMEISMAHTWPATSRWACAAIAVTVLAGCTVREGTALRNTSTGQVVACVGDPYATMESSSSVHKRVDCEDRCSSIGFEPILWDGSPGALAAKQAAISPGATPPCAAGKLPPVISADGVVNMHAMSRALRPD